MKSNRSVCSGFAIEALDLVFKAGELIGCLLEDFKVLNHRLSIFDQSFARDDGRDTGLIDHPKRSRNAPSDLVEWQVVDVVAHHFLHCPMRRHHQLGEMLGAELRRLKSAYVRRAVEIVHFGAEIAQTASCITLPGRCNKIWDHLI